MPLDIRSRLVIDWPSSYDWAPSRLWVQPLLLGFRQLVRVELAPIPQPPKDGVVVCRFKLGRSKHEIAIDISDQSEHLSRPALASAACYFKMQYRTDGYGTDRIVPGGYPAGSLTMYRYLPRLRTLRDSRPRAYNVFARFGLGFNADIRAGAVKMLERAMDLGFVGGTRAVRNSRYLRDMALAKVGIDLPGKGDLCFRLVDYLSIGVCVIRPKPKTELPAPLQDRIHAVYCREDLSDLVQLCREYLANDPERMRIARNARQYFDRFLHREQLARYYVSRALQASS